MCLTGGLLQEPTTIKAIKNPASCWDFGNDFLLVVATLFTHPDVYIATLAAGLIENAFRLIECKAHDAMSPISQGTPQR